jgi:hypothetical protein
MPAKGQLMAPKLPIRLLHEVVMQRITDSLEPVGIFIVGGNLFVMRRSAPGFDKRSKTLNNQLVGVYNFEIDSRCVMADLKTFYEVN